MNSLLITTLFAGALASPIGNALRPRDDTTATVDLSTNRGNPKHLASGFIYGIPDTPDQIPNHFYTDIGFNYARSGGAQLDTTIYGTTARGWIWGEADYQGRLNSTLSNYFTTRKYGGQFILLPHDVWGTDHSNSSTVWPGDNGDWTDYDSFIRTLMSDLKANGALEGLVWDIWNEPELSFFWGRDEAQWLQLYVRTHKIIREDPDFSIVQISGPSLANQPHPTISWWTSWLSAIAGNDTIPDQYSYHLEGSTTDTGNDLAYTNGSLTSMLETYGLPQRLVNVNEYGNTDEQHPSGSAWYMGRLERYDVQGLRGNWLSGTTLHDLMANLLIKKADSYDYLATDYAPTAEFQLYSYYNLNMTGHRVSTTGSADTLFDVYATVDTTQRKVRMVAGSRHATGAWKIDITHLASLGLHSTGSLNVQTWIFNASSVWDELDGPTNLGVARIAYSGGAVTLTVNQTDVTTGWAFEFGYGRGHRT